MINRVPPSIEKKTPVVNQVNTAYLRNFRTKPNTEIVLARYKNIGSVIGSDQANKVKNVVKDAEYIIAEYDRQNDNVLRIEGAKSLDSKIQSSIDKAKNGVLVIS